MSIEIGAWGHPYKPGIEYSSGMPKRVEVSSQPKPNQKLVIVHDTTKQTVGTELNNTPTPRLRGRPMGQ